MQELDNTPKKRLNDPTGVGTQFVTESAAALTGIWAEENTRDALFDALKRKEVFCTSGPINENQVIRRMEFRAKIQ